MKNTLLLMLGLCVLASCTNTPTPSTTQAETSPTAISLFGDSLYASEPSEELVADFEAKLQAYEENPTADNLIWYGRFMAYKGNYKAAIDLYTKGIEEFPEDARFYRHRGHRYISIRAFDKAIADFDKAVALIDGKANEVEPDGMPNAQNIPVSTLHGNIWYHKGLAHYLEWDFENALIAYQNCLSSTANDDNKVSATHWIYMILRRLERVEEAQKALEIIKPEMDVIENMSYHKACLFYKAALDEADIAGTEEAFSANDAMDYAIGNWYLYNGDTTKAIAKYEKIIANGGWNSFGYIAAEADLYRLKE